VPQTTYDRLIEILGRYVSQITVTSMVAAVLAERTMLAQELGADTLIDFVEEVMVGLRLFCPPERLPDLMIELAELCDRETLGANGEASQRPASLLHVR
jgi:hypothetical protein